MFWVTQCQSFDERTKTFVVPERECRGEFKFHSGEGLKFEFSTMSRMTGMKSFLSIKQSHRIIAHLLQFGLIATDFLFLFFCKPSMHVNFILVLNFPSIRQMHKKIMFGKKLHVHPTYNAIKCVLTCFLHCARTKWMFWMYFIYFEKGELHNHSRGLKWNNFERF